MYLESQIHERFECICSLLGEESLMVPTLTTLFVEPAWNKAIYHGMTALVAVHHCKHRTTVYTEVLIVG